MAYEHHNTVRLDELVKPKGLARGDTVATVSSSWCAGELPHRYACGKARLEDPQLFGFRVIEAPNALQPAKWVAANPKARAESLMDAFRNDKVKAIISNIGGDDSIRMIPFIDFDVIRKNPKIYLGFSDSTVTHFICLKAGLSSLYGTSLLCGFAENVAMHQYQIDDLKAVLYSPSSSSANKTQQNETTAAPYRRRIMPNLTEGWTTERLEWFNVSLSNTQRQMVTDRYIGWRFIRGFTEGSADSAAADDGKTTTATPRVVTGRLIGGCMEVLEMIKGTAVWPSSLDVWRGAIVFFETSEDTPRPELVRWWLRNYAATGILGVCGALLFGRAYDGLYQEEYETEILRVLDEEGLADVPVITRMDFGHTAPAFTLPMGCLAEVDCTARTFSLLEPSVL